MNIGFIAPHSISAVLGGMRTQILQTAKALEDLGHSIHFLSPWDELQSTEIDVFHVFGSGIENFAFIDHLKKMNKKVVLSPVLFSIKSGKSVSKKLAMESVISKLGTGIKSEYAYKKECCEMADLILPNTIQEKDFIIDAFGIPSSKFKVVPNGVETRFLDANPNLFVQKYQLKDFILFVGQSSAKRKNVLSLLKAAEILNEQFVIIGSFNNDDYSKNCIQFASKLENVLLIESLEHDSEMLSSAYAACKTFVLPSMFETPGIAALEASLAGANIVITELGGTKEYFGKDAFYMNPKSTDSIAESLSKSQSREKTTDLKNRISEKYTWEAVAKATLRSYLSLEEA